MILYMIRSVKSCAVDILGIQISNNPRQHTVTRLQLELPEISSQMYNLKTTQRKSLLHKPLVEMVELGKNCNPTNG